MSSSGVDLFGHPITEKTKEILTREYKYETCWEDCRFCGKLPFVQSHKDPKFRDFFLCNHPRRPDTRCFKSDGCCELYIRPIKEQPLKPETAGWEDY